MEIIPAKPIPKAPRLYAVEFLRVAFILLIIAGHSHGVFSPEDKAAFLNFFHAKHFSFPIVVEYFFVIGGFFLYKRATSGAPVWSLIKKTYSRLAPGVFFAFLLCLCWKIAHIYDLPDIVFLNVGLALKEGGDMGLGTWFLCVYFWSSCFLIALFSQSPKRAFLWLGVVLYAGFCLRGHIKEADGRGLFLAWHGVWGTWFARGICSMGLGMLGGFLAEKFQTMPKKWPLRILFTLLEAYCLYELYRKVMVWKPSHFSYLSIQLLLVLLLVSIAGSYGYLSAALNKARWIWYLSRYTFAALIGHIIVGPLILVRYHQYFPVSGAWLLVIVIVVGYAVGMFEYHFVERFLVPKLQKWLAPPEET